MRSPHCPNDPLPLIATPNGSVLFSAFSAVYLIFVKVRLFQILYSGHPLHNFIFILLQMPLFPFLSGLAYTFSNLAAIAAISRKGVGLESVSRTWVLSHNTAFCMSPLIFFGVTFVRQSPERSHRTDHAITRIVSPSRRRSTKLPTDHSMRSQRYT